MKPHDAVQATLRLISLIFIAPETDIKDAYSKNSLFQTAALGEAFGLAENLGYWTLPSLLFLSCSLMTLSGFFFLSFQDGVFVRHFRAAV